MRCAVATIRGAAYSVPATDLLGGARTGVPDRGAYELGGGGGDPPRADRGRAGGRAASVAVEQSAAQGLAPRGPLDVEGAEVGREVPVGPAQAEALGLRAHERGPRRAVGHRRVRDGAELAEEQRQPPGPRPRRGALEVGAHPRALGGGAPRGPEPAVCAVDPARAL